MVTPQYRKCDTCGQNRQLKFFKPQGRVCFPCQNKKRRESAHNYRVSRTYGMESGDYAKLLEAQEGKCAICGGTRGYNLAVDHDHKTGYVRGLCCKRCNTHLLVAAMDDPVILRKAAEYLESPPAHKVIGLKKADIPDT